MEDVNIEISLLPSILVNFWSTFQAVKWRHSLKKWLGTTSLMVLEQMPPTCSRVREAARDSRSEDIIPHDTRQSRLQARTLNISGTPIFSKIDSRFSSIPFNASIM